MLSMLIIIIIKLIMIKVIISIKIDLPELQNVEENIGVNFDFFF